MPAGNARGMVGVLLAAGRGRRMGCTKQLLPWPARPDGGERSGPSGTVVAEAFDAIRPFCDRMVVVLGHEADRVREALLPRDFESIVVDADAQMIESIKSGLGIALSIAGATGVLLHPSDHPAVSSATIVRLLEEFRERGEIVAVMPEHQGKGGHPAVVPMSVIPAILASHADGGLRQWWLDHPDACVRINIEDRGVIMDLDTPDDYKSFS